MKRAILLAEQGRGRTSPNPVVGAVLVKNGAIIGEGFHEEYGGLHAEANAIKNACGNAEGAEMYVTLEPCSHYGKQPPCAESIIKNGIKRVYIGAPDPNPLVSGRGVAMLKAAGIEVIEGIHKAECMRQNEIFFKYIKTGLPFVVMKTAMTLDGKTASYSGNSRWITGNASREYVHSLRSGIKGIMVGINTVLVDNPSLTARIPGGVNPVRIIADSRLRIPEDANVLDVTNGSRCIIAAVYPDPDKAARLSSRGIEIIECPSENNRLDLKALMSKLGSIGIDSVLLEGGSDINFSALQSGIVDKIIAYIAPKIIGGRAAPTPVGGLGIELMENAIPLYGMELDKIGDDIMLTAYTNPNQGGSLCLQE